MTSRIAGTISKKHVWVLVSSDYVIVFSSKKKAEDKVKEIIKTEYFDCKFKKEKEDNMIVWHESEYDNTIQIQKEWIL